MKKILLFDFDSTFVTVESLDLLADIALRERTDREEVLENIVAITKQGMEGNISFPESLAKRLRLFAPQKKHIDELIHLLQTSVTISFQRNKNFFQEYADSIYIVSGGFTDYMVPVLKTYGFSENHILGNTFLFDGNGNVLGYDTTNMLSQEKGKVKKVQEMGFHHDVYMIGDGYTDWEVKEAGLATRFIAFIGNVRRNAVARKADSVAYTLEEVLQQI